MDICGGRGRLRRRTVVFALALLLACWQSPVARADDGDPATPATFSDLATARSQIYEGYVALIEGLQDGDGIDPWASDYLEAAFSFAQGTMETVMFVGTLSVPTFGFEWVLLISDVAQQAGTMSQMYSDMSTLMNNWSHGFIIGDLTLIWNSGAFYGNQADDLKYDLDDMQDFCAEEAGLWLDLEQDLLVIYDLEEHMAQQYAKVQDALGPATYIYNTASGWKDSGSVPNTFVCQFGEYSACVSLIDTNYSIAKSIYDFLQGEQVYLEAFLAALEPVEVECTPGATDATPCGNCGKSILECSEEGQWPAGAECLGEGECAPEEVAEEMCGLCGSRVRTCDEACAFSPWSECAGEGECVAGEVQNLSCGLCGIQEQVCLDDCTLAPPGECVESAEQICYPDGDGDGFGDPAAAEAFCECPEGMTSKSYDCDDTDANVHPEMVEECNGVDDDCDDDVDEGACPEIADEGTPSEDSSAPSEDVKAGEDAPPGDGGGADLAGAAAEDPGEVSSPAGSGGCSTGAAGSPAWPALMVLVVWVWARRKENEMSHRVGGGCAGVVLHSGGQDS